LDRLQDAKDNLRDILSLPLDQEIEVKVTIDYESVDIDPDKAIEVALRHRIELDQARDQIAESRRLVCVAKNNLLPDLNVVVDYTSYAWDEAFTRSWTTKRESKWGIGLVSTGDFDNDRQRASYEGSLISKDDAIRNAEQVHDNIILDVKRTLRLLTRAEEKIALQEEQVQNSRKEFHLSRLKFEHGLANNFDLIQAEKNLRSAQSSLVSAIIEHRIGEFKLLAALGTLADKPGLCR
jgi:outer membrane protein TolC